MLPTIEDLEVNRGRVELRTVVASDATNPEQAGFTSARQIAYLRRRVTHADGKKSDEIVHLISSLEPGKASATDLKKIKRKYWGIESTIHYRLDDTLDEDRSRVRNRNSALVLGMFRRLAVSLAIPWIAEEKKKRKRTSTRDFFDYLKEEKGRRAFDLITSKKPTSLKN